MVRKYAKRRYETVVAVQIALEGAGFTYSKWGATQQVQAGRLARRQRRGRLHCRPVRPRAPTRGSPPASTSRPRLRGPRRRTRQVRSARRRDRRATRQATTWSSTRRTAATLTRSTRPSSIHVRADRLRPGAVSQRLPSRLGRALFKRRAFRIRRSRATFVIGLSRIAVSAAKPPGMLLASRSIMRRRHRALRLFLCCGFLLTLFGARLAAGQEPSGTRGLGRPEKGGDAAKAAGLSAGAGTQPAQPRCCTTAPDGPPTCSAATTRPSPRSKRALEFDPSLGQAAALLGTVVYANSELDLAVRSMEKAAKLAPENEAYQGATGTLAEGVVAAFEFQRTDQPSGFA